MYYHDSGESLQDLLFDEWRPKSTWYYIVIILLRYFAYYLRFKVLNYSIDDFKYFNNVVLF